MIIFGTIVRMDPQKITQPSYRSIKFYNQNQKSENFETKMEISKRK